MKYLHGRETELLGARSDVGDDVLERAGGVDFEKVFEVRREDALGEVVAERCGEGGVHGRIVVNMRNKPFMNCCSSVRESQDNVKGYNMRREYDMRQVVGPW